MNCPACQVPMIPGLKLECKTGNAQQFVCRQCGAKHWKQLSDTVGMTFRPLREINRHVAALSV